jgi:hypothetical protein
MEFRINSKRIEEILKKIVHEHREEIHNKESWWNGVINGYLEALGLEWEVIDRIENGVFFD